MFADPVSRRVLAALSACVLAYLVFPLIVVLPVSFSAGDSISFPPPGLSTRWYAKYFSDASWLGASWMSLKIAVITACLSTVLGTAASFGLVRGQYPLKGAVQAFILSPVIIPVIILSVAFYRFYADLGLTGSMLGIVLAHTVIATPFVVMTVSASLTRFDTRLEQASLGLGASRSKTFMNVTLPLIRPAVLVGALFAFMTSFDEILIALFIGKSTAPTLPMKMWETLRTSIDPTIAAVSILLIVLSLAVFTVSEIASRRREAIGGSWRDDR